MTELESTTRIYLALKYREDHGNRGLADGIANAFDSLGIAVTSVAGDVERWGETSLEPDELMRVAFDLIEHSTAVLIEFSEKGVGLGIEAGYAAASGIPVFVIHPPGIEVSQTLQGIAIDVIQYTDSASLEGAAARIASGLHRFRVSPQVPTL